MEKDIFKKGSTTYYWSSKFFPKGIRDDVFKLYSFVRIVDDYVDNVPADIDSFNRMMSRWRGVRVQLKNNNLPKINGEKLEDLVLKNIAYIVYRYDCDVEWVDAFLESMQMDIDNKVYKNLDDTLEYIYGSAEVIGLMMSKIMQLPIAPYEYAKMQGRAMQFINFLRDIDEDNDLGRQYFSTKTLSEFGLKDLTEKTAKANPEAFKEFINCQLALYEQWQSEANKGFSYIPKRLRVPLKTAVDMYNWTAQEIKKDPFVIYRKKVKPTKQQILRRATANMLKG